MSFMTVMENLEIYDEFLLFSVLVTHLVPIEFIPAWRIEAKRYHYVYVINKFWKWKVAIHCQYKTLHFVSRTQIFYEFSTSTNNYTDKNSM